MGLDELTPFIYVESPFLYSNEGQEALDAAVAYEVKKGGG